MESMNKTFIHRDHIKGILLKKYRSKFRTTRNPLFASAITQEIDDLMKTRNINQTHLSALEKKLNSLTISMCNPSPNSIQNGPIRLSEVKNGTQQLIKASDYGEENHKKLSQSFIAEQFLPPIRITSESIEEDQWMKLMEHDIKKYTEERRNALLNEQEKKKKVKEELFKQIQEKKTSVIGEKMEETMYNKKLIKLTESMNEQEKKKMLEKNEKIRKENQLRDRQLKDKHSLFT